MSERLRRECTDLVASLYLPTQFDARELCEQLSRARGRPVRLISMEMPAGGPSGMLVPTQDADLVIYERRTSRIHQEHIITHEAAHLLMADEAGPGPGATLSEHSRLLFPDLDPALVQQVLTRSQLESQYDDEVERRAELVASLIRQRGKTWTRTPSKTALLRRFRSYAQLYPLWRAMYDVMPWIALNPPRTHLPARWTLRDLDHRLYRRIVEILDGRLALSEYVAAPHHDAAENAPSSRSSSDSRRPVTAAAHEAAMLAGALAARAAGTINQAPVASTYPAAGDHSELAAQLNWLLEVSAAYRRHRVTPAP